jgi:hypothetical protein
MEIGWRGGLALVLVLAAPAAGLAQDVALDEPRVAAAVESCGERTTEDFLAERLAAQGLDRPGTGLDQALELTVDRALDPAKRPAQAAEDLAALAERDGSGEEDRLALTYFTLRNFAYYEALTCQALVQWYGQLLVFRDLLDGAAPSDAKRDHYARGAEQARLKLALTVRQRDRLAEKERLARAAVGLAAP